MAAPIRVLIADDSSLMRRLLCDIIERAPDLRVVGTARDGVEAVDLAVDLRPDVIVLDVQMPRLDGLAALDQIMAGCPTPVVMVSGVLDARQALQALDRGAVEVVAKPSGPISIDVYKVATELVGKIRLASQVPVTHIDRPGGADFPVCPDVAPQPAPARFKHGRLDLRRVIVVAASTGGPQAIEAIIPALPGDLAAAVIIVQHMPVGFTRCFAERLNQRSGLHVREARSGDVIAPGRAYIAPAGHHLLVSQRRTDLATLRLDQSPPLGGLRPAADVTMRSAAVAFGPATIGLVLTGMGTDGADGLRWIKACGGQTLAQDQTSSVVYGMPWAAVEAGVVDRVLSLTDIATELVKLVSRDGQSAEFG
jgi:two-component system chemotaxis response regulator CheB